jgi:hypothetical protein
LSLQARQSGQGRSLAPLANDLARRIEFGRDLVVGQTFIGKQDDLGTDQTHSIPARKTDTSNGTTIARTRRVSITFRAIQPADA